MGGALAVHRYWTSETDQLPLDFINIDVETNKENALHTPERANGAREILAEARDHLQYLKHYQSCTELIRVAISSPADTEKLEATIAALVPNIERINDIYHFSQKLTAFYETLIREINVLEENDRVEKKNSSKNKSKGNSDRSTSKCDSRDDEHVDNNLGDAEHSGAIIGKSTNITSTNSSRNASGLGEAHASSLLNRSLLQKCVSEILVFMITFDQLKIRTPQLQNDFSYYRRLLSTIGQRRPEFTVSEEEANGISLFLAAPSPISKVLIDFSLQLMKIPDLGGFEFAEIFSEIANACAYLVYKRKTTSTEMDTYCLKAMTGAIVLYDHTSRSGALSSKSMLKTKKCLKALKVGVHDNDMLNQLRNFIRYSGKSFTEQSMPSSIRTLLNDDD